MENLQRIAVLIDADNTILSKLKAVMQEISTRGRIVVKRAYGNWRKDTLKNWEAEMGRLAIKAEQQFDYVVGKNATDMALVIDTMNLLHRDLYDAFVIVSSDSDYTPLTIHLHESGVYVIGVGEKKTPEPFRNSCDEFIFLENLSVKSDEEPEAPAIAEEPAASPVDVDTDDLEEIHHLLRIASNTYQDEDGYVNGAAAGSYIRRIKPDFDPRTYGYAKLAQLIEAFPEHYETHRLTRRSGAPVFYYRCREDN